LGKQYGQNKTKVVLGTHWEQGKETKNSSPSLKKKKKKEKKGPFMSFKICSTLVKYCSNFAEVYFLTM
jgi:hypothetical protein